MSGKTDKLTDFEKMPLHELRRSTIERAYDVHGYNASAMLGALVAFVAFVPATHAFVFEAELHWRVLSAAVAALGIGYWITKLFVVVRYTAEMTARRRALESRSRNS